MMKCFGNLQGYYSNAIEAGDVYDYSRYSFQWRDEATAGDSDSGALRTLIHPGSNERAYIPHIHR
jgi:hypothetical protein